MVFDNLLTNPSMLPKEQDDDSYIEYKRHLSGISDHTLSKRTSQMLSRLHEGYQLTEQMICTYLLGVNDDGSLHGLDKKDRKRSVKNLKRMVEGCGCNAFIYSHFIKKIKNNKYIIQVNIMSHHIPSLFVH